MIRSLSQLLCTKGPVRGFGVFLNPEYCYFIKFNHFSYSNSYCQRRYGPRLLLSTYHDNDTNAKSFTAENKFPRRNDRIGSARTTLDKRSANILQDLRRTKQKIKMRMGSLKERENIWTVPNFLCISRIIVTPYMGYLILNQDCELALYLLVFAGFTDWLDGFIARNFKKQSSKFGSFLDPMADKILMATLFLSLTYADLMPVPLTAVIVARDVILFGSGFYVRYLSLPKPITFSLYFDASHATAQLKPTFISKVNTLVQLCTAAVTLSSPVFNFTDHPYLLFLWWLTGVSTVVSGLSYVFSKNTYRILKDVKKKKKML